MKKKGFTLIELLAVIVVLAIIALIATPIVMNTIKRVQKSAAERSADSYIKQVETVVATERLDGNILEGEYEITSDGNICRDKKVTCSDKDKIIIDMKGTKPSSGKITISNGNAEISEKITVGTFDVVYNPTTKSYEATEKGSSSSEDGNDQTIVYRWSMDAININDVLDESQYTKDQTTLGKNYYFKYFLDDENKISKAYTCIKYDNNEICLQGGSADYYGYAEDKANYTGNLLVLKNAQDKGFSCYFTDDAADGSYCSNNSYYLATNPTGYVRSAISMGGCSISSDGIAGCS